MAIVSCLAGLELVYLNFPEHLAGLQAADILAALSRAGLQAGGIALRFPKQMGAGAMTNPVESVRKEAVPWRRHLACFKWLRWLSPCRPATGRRP